MAPSQPSLPSNRVFVVQFRRPPTGAPASYDGRVEHLVSGQVARFYALEALSAFMTRALADMLCTPTQGGQRPRAVEAVALEGTISVSSQGDLLWTPRIPASSHRSFCFFPSSRQRTCKRWCGTCSRSCRR